MSAPTSTIFGMDGCVAGDGTVNAATPDDLYDLIGELSGCGDIRFHADIERARRELREGVDELVAENARLREALEAIYDVPTTRTGANKARIIAREALAGSGGDTRDA